MVHDKELKNDLKMMPCAALTYHLHPMTWLNLPYHLSLSSQVFRLNLHLDLQSALT
jgi:hypothetical protein